MPGPFTRDDFYRLLFGQVENDQLVVNLTAIPTFYPDKRPFFTENLGLFTTDPDKAVEAAKVATETMISFVADGPFEKEMETVHKQMKNQLDIQMREPFYWTTVLSDMDFRGTKLSDVKELVAKMTTYTRDDVIKVMKQYIIDDRRIEAIAKPAPKK